MVSSSRFGKRIEEKIRRHPGRDATHTLRLLDLLRFKVKKLSNVEFYGPASNRNRSEKPGFSIPD
jgi:hypothetical protein